MTRGHRSQEEFKADPELTIDILEFDVKFDLFFEEGNSQPNKNVLLPPIMIL